MNNRILFDASSTNPVSGVIAVAPGDCVQINAWNLGPGEVAEVFRLLVEDGSIPAATQGSCYPPVPITPAEIVQEAPYVPCNQPVQVGQTASQNITTIVISQPGFYNLHLTPAALGTAFVEAIALTGEDACAQAAAACCCTPTLRWAGTSSSPCLTITPGGPVGNEPIFGLDPCCVLQQIVNPVVPNIADSIIVLQGGACGRATLQDVFNLVNTCATLAGFPLLPFAPLDSLIAVDAGANCKRIDAAALVAGLETPWTGTSNNPNLTITPGGVNGHAPVFDYDWCADMQALPSCGCEPNPGDGVAVIQGGACVLATWPTTDLCDQISLLANGALLAGDTVPVREAGGACKQVLASSLQSGFDGGPIGNPILGPNGSCAAPTYSFTASTDSGMFYDPSGLGSVVIGDDNCADFIAIGASVNVVSTASNITVSATAGVVTTLAATINSVAGLGIAMTTGAGDVVLTATTGEVNITAATNVEIRTAAILRVAFDVAGAWQLAGNPGLVGQAITSAGPGLPPVWATPSSSVAFPLLAPTNPVPQYSFTGCPDGGMAYDGFQVFWGVRRPAGYIFSSGMAIACASVCDMEIRGERSTAVDLRGAHIFVKAGRADGVGAITFQNDGGNADFQAGDSVFGRGGTVAVVGGSNIGGAGLQVGGDARLIAGSGNITAGTVIIRGGGGGGPGVYAGGGSIQLRTDAGNAGDLAFPSFTLDHHNAVMYGDPVVISIPSRSSSRAQWYGMVGDTVTTRGQDVRIWAGPGLNQGNGGHGGDLELMGGNGSSGPSNNGGQLFISGGALSGTGIKGWVQLEMRNSAQGPPTQTPQFTSGFLPIVLHDDGANVHFYAWCQSAAAWQSVMLT